MKELIYIFLGGGVGSLLRYAIQLLMNNKFAAASLSFPWATFSVNIAGSFLIGLFYALSARLNMPSEIRLLLTTGLCGGFTTFSTFSNESLSLLRQGLYTTFAIYVGLSLALGILAAFLGALSVRPD